MLPGLIGREPWKADEPYTVGMVLHIAETGDWITPTLGGEPFMEKPPFFYFVSSLFARAFSPLMEFHTAARLGTMFFMGLTFWCVALASRKLNGSGKDWVAAALLAGCLGLSHTAHYLITDISLLTGFAVAIYGMTLCRERPIWGGVLCGTGIGMAFMSKGLLGPGLLGVSMVALLVLKPWRTPQYLLTLVTCGLCALPWVVIWPWALYQRSHEQFHTWFFINNWGRFTGSSVLGATNEPFFYFYVVPLYGIPAFPLMIWTLWKEKWAGIKKPEVLLPVLVFVVMFAILQKSSSGRALYALPLYIPLALLAARNLDKIPAQGLRMSFRIFAGLFGLLTLVLWVGWVAQLAGAEWVLKPMRKVLPSYQPAFHWPTFVAGLVVTGAYLIWLVRQKKDVACNLGFNWLAGLACVYGVVMTLGLPYLNQVGSMRPLGDIQKHIPAGETVMSINLGESQRGMMHYYAGLKTKRLEVLKEPLPDCKWLLVQTKFNEGEWQKLPPGNWQLTWKHIHRQKEIYWLYRKTS